MRQAGRAEYAMLCPLGVPRRLAQGTTSTPRPTSEVIPLTGGKGMARHPAGQQEREEQPGSHGRNGSLGSLQGEHTGSVIGG